jgi:hypothetical protein
VLSIPAGESERRESECEAEKASEAGGFVGGTSPDAEKSDASPGKDIVHKAVSASPVGSIVRAVVELDSQHEGRGARVAKNEVEVFLRDSAAVAVKPIGRRA